VLWSGYGFGHKLAARVLAPAGDPHITFQERVMPFSPP
jgi:hypothetical protein